MDIFQFERVVIGLLCFIAVGLACSLGLIWYLLHVKIQSAVYTPDPSPTDEVPEGNVLPLLPKTHAPVPIEVRKFGKKWVDRHTHSYDLEEMSKIPGVSFHQPGTGLRYHLKFKKP